MNDGQAYCACLTVKYDPEETETYIEEFGKKMRTMRERWTCAAGCGSHFIRKGVADHKNELLLAERGAQLSLLKDIRRALENPAQAVNADLWKELCSATDGETTKDSAQARFMNESLGERFSSYAGGGIPNKTDLLTGLRSEENELEKNSEPNAKA